MQRFPDYWILWHDKALFERTLNQKDDAAVSYQKAIDLHYEDGWFWSWQDLGDLYNEGLKDFARSIEFYNRAIERAAAEEKGHEWRAWHGRANALRRLKKYDKAIEAYDKTIELHGEGFPWCWYALGDCHQQKKPSSLVRAFECYCRSLDLEAGYERAQEARDALLVDFKRVLHQHLDAHLNLDRFRTLCFYLDVDYDSLPGEGKSGKVRELILHLQVRDQLLRLIEQVRRVLPGIELP